MITPNLNGDFSAFEELDKGAPMDVKDAGHCAFGNLLRHQFSDFILTAV